MRSNFQEISLSSFFFKLRFLRDIFFLRILHLFLPRLGGFSSKPSLLSFPLRIDLCFLSPSFSNLPLSFFIFSFVSNFELNCFNLRFFFFLALLAKFTTKRCLRSFFEIFLFHACSTLSRNKTKLTSTSELNEPLYFATNFKTNKITVG